MRFLQDARQALYRPDLLSVYIRNTNVSYIAAGAFIFIFFYINKNLYMALDIINIFGLVFLYAVSILFFIRCKKYYMKLLSNGQYLQKDFFHVCFTILCMKTVIIICLLSVFFWPIQNTHLEDEFIGLAAAACLLVLFSSIGTAYYPFLIYDVLLISGFVIWILSQTVQGTTANSVYLAILFFSLYALILGRIINHSTVSMLDNQRKLKVATERARSAYKAKSEFLAVMSHEIRTPMNGIMGMLDFLNETKLTKSQKEYVEAIGYCSKTLLNTLNDILDISRMEAGKLVINSTEVSLYEFLNQINMVFKHNAEAKGLGFYLVKASDLPEHIVVDPNRLNQIVTNLLNNALKFTDKGRIDFDVSFNPHKKIIKFTIKDSGIGIRQEDQVHLFKQFSQIDGSTSRKFGGTGLGLSIVHNLVREMGGHIGVFSNVKEGSTFWFTIPFQDQIQPQRAIVLDRGEAYKIDVLQGVCILVVDDNDLNQTIVKKYLSKIGADVFQAKSGWEAIEKVKACSFDLILMDLQMPDMDGYQVTQAIKKIESAARTPILALSANVLQETIESCLAAGMAGHISKPIDKDELFSKLYAMLKVNDTVKNTRIHGLINKGRLSSIMEEFGPDYALGFIKDSIVEAERRLVELNFEIVNGQMDKACAIAHDLVSITGNVGMDMSARTAGALEHSCANWDQEWSALTFSKLKKYMQEEGNEIQKIVQSAFSDSDYGEVL